MGSKKDTATYDYIFKILVIGDAGVGKTCLINRFVDDEFRENEACTIGTEFRVKIVNLNNSSVKLTIWDTAGQERFRSLTTAWYRQAHAILLVYDVTNRESFQNVVNWAEEVDRNSTFPNAVKLIVGNKLDLEGARKVSFDEGQRLAMERKTMFIECSAKERTGVQQAFEELVLKTLQVPEFSNKAPSGRGDTGFIDLKSSPNESANPPCPC